MSKQPTLFFGVSAPVFTPRFDGPDVNDEDHARLSSQLAAVKLALRGGQWWTLAELAAHVGGSEAGVSARLRDLRKPRFGGYEIDKQRIAGGGLWRYRLGVV